MEPGANENDMLIPKLNNDAGEPIRQQASEETEHRLRQIIDNITAVVFLKDTEGRYLYANKRCLQLFGREESDVIGRRDTDVFPADIAGRFQANDREVLETHRAREFEETIVEDDGLHTYLSMKFPVVDAAGRTTALCGIASDITDRKRMEDVFRDAALAVSAARSDALYKELVRYLANLLKVDFAFIAVVDPEGPRMMHMRAFYADGRIIENMEYPLAGTPCETVVGQGFRFYPTGVTTRFPADVEFKTMCVDGYAGYPLNDSRGQPIGLIAVVSRKPLGDPQLIESSLKIFAVRAAAEIERTRAEEALRASEAQYRAIFSTSLDGMLVVAADGTVVDANPAFLALFGYARENLVGTLAGGLLPPEDRKLTGQLLDMARAGQDLQVDRGLRQDGTVVDVEVRGAPMQHEGRPHLLFIVRDISRRKQAEAARGALESQLRQAQKMEAIGHVTGGIAHDFNNILTSVLGYLVLAEERPAANEDGKLARYLRQAGLSARRARDLIQQMLTFSRGQRGNPEAVYLPDLVRESLNLLGSMLPSTIELRTGTAASVPPVMLDPVQANQVLLNLCINARDAMGGSGTLRVDVRQHAGLDLACSSCRKPVQGDFIELAVSDTGPGISPQIVERMFEPFFTTKEVGKGTGMGLATVHGIVHEHDGHVVVESAPGQGATFRVFYPSMIERADADAPQPAADEGDAAAGAEARRLDGRVLLADDDAMVRDYMRDLLEGWDLEVTTAENGAVAYDIFASIPGRFDLVITDQTMPRMTGMQLAEQLLARHPDLPIILYTGYSEGLGEDDVTARGIRALVRKPIDTGALFDLLAAELAPGDYVSAQADPFDVKGSGW